MYCSLVTCSILILSEVYRRITGSTKSEKEKRKEKYKKYLHEQDSAKDRLIESSEVPFYLSIEKGSINHAVTSH